MMIFREYRLIFSLVSITIFINVRNSSSRLVSIFLNSPAASLSVYWLLRLKQNIMQIFLSDWIDILLLKFWINCFWLNFRLFIKKIFPCCLPPCRSHLTSLNSWNIIVVIYHAYNVFLLNLNFAALKLHLKNTLPDHNL